MNPAIVIIAFNRPDSLKKLLNSIDKAHYPTSNIPLVISIDYQDSKSHHEVLKIATDFFWPHGSKRLIEHSKNLGLRDHVLSCGDLTQTYNSVIVLEDDLTVAYGFYDFALAAEKFYHKEGKVAGISLYAYEYEELGWFRFYPKNSDGNTFFMQWAGSRGQVWSKDSWKKFRNWYRNNNNIDDLNIPYEVKRWKNSWKKFFIGYLVNENRFYVYPYISYSTVNDKEGTHYKETPRMNNVCLNSEKGSIDFKFTLFQNCESKYDSFFQPVSKTIYVNDLKKDVEVEFDLFGTKKLYNFRAPYVLTTKPSSKVINSYSNILIPYEDNLLINELGSYFVLSERKYIRSQNDLIKIGEMLYFSRKIFAIKEMILVVIFRILFKLKSFFKI